jgi:penicillin-binding protein 1A
VNKTLRFVLFGLLALVVTAGVAIFLVVKLTLTPAAGEWETRLAWGPLGLDVSVPATLRLATSSWFAPELDGRSFDTRYGAVHFAWNGSSESLELQCAPCSAVVPALGAQPVRVDRLFATVKRDGNTLGGLLDAAPVGSTDEQLKGTWSGRLSPKALQLDIDVQDAPIAEWYAVLAPTIPELQRARIGGTLATHARVTLPTGAFTLQPRIAQFTVEGLGAEAALGALGSCGAPSKLTKDSWLARAVLSAEDQRFFTHTGYDPTELTAAFDGNQKSGRDERGSSTLTQQLARWLVTDSDRTAERELRELLYAVEVEQTLGKARILQLYLDNAPWGDNLCGAESAARHYFKRSAARLEPAQAVWLAAMLDHPQLAVEKWQRDGGIDMARAKWVADGVRGISKTQRESLLKSVAAAKFAPP